MHIQGPHPPRRSLAWFSFGPRLLLLLDLHSRLPWPLPDLFCHNFLQRLTTRDVPLAKNPSTGTAQQRLFLVLKVVLHAVVVISEVLRLSTKSRCSRCCGAHLYSQLHSPANSLPALLPNRSSSKQKLPLTSILSCCSCYHHVCSWVQ